MRHGARILLSLALAGLAACGGRDTPPVSRSAPPQQFIPEPSAFDALPGWRDENKALVVAAFTAGCRGIADPGFAPACAAAGQLPQGDENAAREFLRTRFRPVRLGTSDVTGYFELTLNGSRTPTPRFHVPVLRDSRQGRQYDRPDIMAGVLAGQGLEILYLESEADLYFLQLQGSGRVVLPDGSLVRLGTAASNGRPRIPPAVLFGDAAIPGHDLSIPGLRAWAANHRPEFNGRIAHDMVYVFFRETSQPLQYGPYGAFGLPLLPMRSAAVDPRSMPLGAMFWLDSYSSQDHVALPHLMLAHDTGDLIAGPARVDVFFGWGDKAEQTGGRQNARGTVWVLMPK